MIDELLLALSVFVQIIIKGAMYTKTLVVFLAYICIGFAKRLPFPSYIKRCSLSAPNFDDCCLQNGREAIPLLQKGDKKYNIPNMLPLVLPLVSLETGPDFALTLTDLQVHGLGTADLKKVKFDLANRKISGQVYFDGMELIGKYDVNGRVLVIPLQGKGDINVTIVGCTVDYSVDYELVEREGEEYASINDGTSNIALKRVYFHLTDLFNGNKELGESTNKVLNDEWEQLVGTLKPVIGKTIVDVANSIINGFALNVPFKEFFLD